MYKTELEKRAIKANFIRRVLATARSKGWRGAIEYASKFKDPTHALALGKNGIPSKTFTDPKQVADVNLFLNPGKALARGGRTSAGNMAENLRIVSKNTEGKGFFSGATQVAKNTGELMARQIKGDTVREISGTVLAKDGKRFIKSNYPWMSNREILSETGRGSYLVKKRIGILPASLALGGSGVSIGAASYVLGDKEAPKTQRLQSAVKDTALFTAGIPIGIAGTVAIETAKSKKAKNNKKQNDK